MDRHSGDTEDFTTEQIFNNDLILENIFQYFDATEQFELSKVCRFFNFVICEQIWKKQNKFIIIKPSQTQHDRYSIVIVRNSNKSRNNKYNSIDFKTKAEIDKFLKLNQNNIQQLQWDNETQWNGTNKALQWPSDRQYNETASDANETESDLKILNLRLDNLKKLTLNYVQINSQIVKTIHINFANLRELIILEDISMNYVKPFRLELSNLKTLKSLTLRCEYLMDLEEFCKLLCKLDYLEIQEKPEILIDEEEDDSEDEYEQNGQTESIESALKILQIDEMHINLILRQPQLSSIAYDHLEKLYISNFLNIDYFALQILALKCPFLKVLYFIHSSFALLYELPDEFLSLQNLQELSFEYSDSLSYRIIKDIFLKLQLKKLSLYETIINEEPALQFNPTRIHFPAAYSMDSLTIGFEDDIAEILLGTQQFWFKLFEFPVSRQIFRNLQELFVSVCWNHFNDFLNLFCKNAKNLKCLYLEYINLKTVNFYQLIHLEQLYIRKSYNFTLWKLLKQIGYLANIKELTLEIIPIEEQQRNLKNIPSTFPRISTVPINLQILTIKHSVLKTNIINDLLKFLKFNFSQRLILNLHQSCLHWNCDMTLIKELIFNKKINRNLKMLVIEDRVVDDFGIFYELVFDPLIFKHIWELTFGDYKIDLLWTSNQIKDYINSIAENWFKTNFTILFKFVK